MRGLLFLCCLAGAAGAFAQVDTTQQVVSGRLNSPAQQEKPYVILISADGFRHDYAEKYQAEHIRRLSGQGVQAEALIPSYPSLTFPNHYTLATGLYPAHHGLVGNNFYDPEHDEFYRMSNRQQVTEKRWYGGIPLWVLAEQQQMLSASFYWVGSEAPIKGIYPSFYYYYNEQIPVEQRIQTVVSWLELPPARRPHLILFYLPEPDHAGHLYGPDSFQARQAVRSIDSAVGKLAEAVAATNLPVNFIFVSDHGMTELDPSKRLALPEGIDTAAWTVCPGELITGLYAKDKRAIKPLYKKLKREARGYRVYLKKDMPAYLHYGAKDDHYNRIGDLLLVPDWPRAFRLSNRVPFPGRHGYDPYRVKDMLGIFYAWGPAFEKGLKLPAFENIHVYPIVSAILGLDHSHSLDGTTEIAEKVLITK